jgi:hypothetical protein
VGLCECGSRVRVLGQFDTSPFVFVLVASIYERGGSSVFQGGTTSSSSRQLPVYLVLLVFPYFSFSVSAFEDSTVC